MARRSKSSHGWTKVRAEFAGSQSDRFKFSSFDKAGCFLQEQPAVFCRGVVTRELDQVAAVEKIFQQRFFILRKGRGLRQGGEKFDGCLTRYRQLILVGHITPKNVGDADAKLIGRQSLYFAADPVKQLQGSPARRGLRLRTQPSAPDPPSEQTDENEGDDRAAENYPRGYQRVINRRRDVVEFFDGKEKHRTGNSSHG